MWGSVGRGGTGLERGQGFEIMGPGIEGLGVGVGVLGLSYRYGSGLEFWVKNLVWVGVSDSGLDWGDGFEFGSGLQVWV